MYVLLLVISLDLPLEAAGNPQGQGRQKKQRQPEANEFSSSLLQRPNPAEGMV